MSIETTATSDPAVDINQLLTCANVIELTKRTLTKIGLEFAAPLEPGVLDEKILKAINRHSDAPKGAQQ